VSNFFHFAYLLFFWKRRLYYIESVCCIRRQDQFLSLLNKAMNSDSARFCDIVNLSNSENLKFSAVEIRSALEDLHSNGIIFFHDAEDVVYSI